VTIVLFDKNFNFLDFASTQVDGSGAQISASYTVKEAGYAYLYISNENATQIDIYFDDVTMSYTPSNILQYNEYYPFGLQVSAKSWTRDSTTNNFLFDGGNEFNPNSIWYETFFRGYDPQLGRFHQMDPMMDKYGSFSPYNYGSNNPILFNDPLGADDDDDDVGCYDDSEDPGKGPAATPEPQDGNDWYGDLYYGSEDWDADETELRSSNNIGGVDMNTAAELTAADNGDSDGSSGNASWQPVVYGNLTVSFRPSDNDGQMVAVVTITGTSTVLYQTTFYMPGILEVTAGSSNPASQGDDQGETWYYAFQNGHALAYRPATNIFYEINHPTIKGKVVDGKISWLLGGAKSQVYVWRMDDDKAAQAFWNFGTYNTTRPDLLLAPVQVSNPAAAVSFFETNVGGAYPYNVTYNNCQTYIMQGLGAGGANFGGVPLFIGSWQSGADAPVLNQH